MSARETFSPLKDREIVKITRTKAEETKPVETKPEETKPKIKSEVKPEIIVDNSAIVKEFRRFEKNILDQINLGGTPSLDTSKYGLPEKSGGLDKKIILFSFLLGFIILGYYKKDWLFEKYLTFKFRNFKESE